MSSIDDLRKFLDASPSPAHVVASASSRLIDAGFTVGTFGSSANIDFTKQRGALTRGGSLIAWNWGSDSSRADVLVVGAHTDSPTFRLKPTQGTSAAGFGVLDVEVYGGVLLNSWLDRDLGVAGVVHTADGDSCLVDLGPGVARIPQLAIHLDRDVNEKGLVLNRQAHTRPVWTTTSQDFAKLLRDHINGVEIVASDLVLYDSAQSAVIGADKSLLASGRLDNQVSCWAAIDALVNGDPQRPFVVALFDHEEVGSESATGAAGPMLELVLKSLVESRSNVSWIDVVQHALCISADNAHALHPNYLDRHDPNHAPIVNRGPVLKSNANQRYATSARGAAVVRAAANDAGVSLQHFVSNNVMPCGSTIGPITATRLGIETVDIGVPQLSMHSARELCGTADPVALRTLLVGMASH